MKEKDIHELIEQQDPAAKQRIWEKIVKQTTGIAATSVNVESSSVNNECKSNCSKDSKL